MSSSKIKESRERWRLKNPEKFLEINRNNQRARRKKNPLKFMLIAAKSRAKKRELPFNITIEDVSLPEVCPILNIPLVFSSIKYTHGSPTLDRINNSEGYVRGNVRVISFRANLLKSDMNLEECRLILKDLQARP